MASTDTVSKALKRAKPRRSPFARTQRGEPFQADDTIAQTEPMDTARLAEEIERIMRRRERQTERVPQRPHRAWLGEREDIALVERSERMATARTVGAAPGEESNWNMVAESDSDAKTGASIAATTYDAKNAVTWVRRAKRQKLRSRLREAAGWAVSTVIVLAILIAVGISVYGPKNLDWGIKQNLVSTLKINRGSGGMTIEEASAVIDPAATTQATRTPANSVR